MEPRHALLIDDDLKNLNILARLLIEQGVQNTQVGNSKQLEITLENSGKVDVVFLDLEMPGLNGYEILEKLKNDSRFVGVPVVAYTVHASEINRAHELGFHSFIGKPIDADKFPSQLGRILNHEPVWETV